MNYVTSADAAHELAREIEELGPKVLVVQADVTEYDQVGEMIKLTIETFGQIDILVNNAGITRDKTLKNMTREHWDEVVDVNLGSLFNCTKQVLPFMLERKSGKIVNISSFVAQGGNVGPIPSVTTKPAPRAGSVPSRHYRERRLSGLHRNRHAHDSTGAYTPAHPR